MGRGHVHRKNRDKNANSLPQTPANLKRPAVEYSEELADADDLEAQARANAANQRVKMRQHRNLNK
ncbi:YfhD-like protein [Bacillus oleivorans]|uniref:YfhD-like protein n=1 Tax=Bacillus oleivorans TaxID=1448271 RepID=A0A285CTP0_9BACI|nr:YfhD family protein [Bacillus oleivorans]SNX70323.1 YfhD-like protein [Bacillus oleivorans]